MPMKISLGAAALTLLAAAAAVQAEGARTPGDMTDEEREKIVAVTMDYENCLREAAGAVVAKMDDVRAIADAASVECEPRLQGLSDTLQGFEPEFQESLTQSTRERGLRKLLPQLMEVKAGSSPQ